MTRALETRFCDASKARYERTMDSYVYVLGYAAKGPKGRCLTYVGWTTDPDRRLAQHNAGKGARSTRGRQWVLLYSEKCESRNHAMSREWHIKRDRMFRRELAQALRV